jgi:hypothetical protein
MGEYCSNKYIWDIQYGTIVLQCFRGVLHGILILQFICGVLYGGAVLQCIWEAEMLQ